MTATTPTGHLWIDLALFAAFFVVAFGIVWIGSAIEIRRAKK